MIPILAKTFKVGDMFHEEYGIKVFEVHILDKKHHEEFFKYYRKAGRSEVDRFKMWEWIYSVSEVNQKYSHILVFENGVKIQIISLGEDEDNTAGRLRKEKLAAGVRQNQVGFMS